MLIGNRRIGRDSSPIVIAELSGNHGQSLDRAIAMVEAVARSGAHALKLQTFKPATITLDIGTSDFYIDDENSLWKGRSLFDLYTEAHTPWEWHQPIFDRAFELGLIAFSTPFDESAVDFLEDLGVPCYKIASFENNHLPLIKKVASTGKPLFLSTGMATRSELSEAVEVVRKEGCRDLVLMKCTSAYPAQPQDANILTIPDMRTTFQCEVGISDHSLGIGVSVAAVAYGAVAIEKHFTLSRDKGVDAAFSLESPELKALVDETTRAWKALGTIYYGSTESEIGSERFRRSIYTTRDLKAGDILSENCIRIIRPGLGLAPKFFPQLLGRQVSNDLPAGSPITWEDIVHRSVNSEAE